MTDDFFAQNRKKLLAQLPKHAVVVMSAYREMQLAADMAVPFLQEANFWYVSGLEAPDWWIVFSDDVSFLVAPTLDATKIAFDGLLDEKRACRISGVQEVVDRTEAKLRLSKLISGRPAYTALQSPHLQDYATFVWNPAQADMQKYLLQWTKQVDDCAPQLAKLRAIKSAPEVACLERAIAVTQSGIDAVRAATVAHEYEAEAIVTAAFRRQGARHAYEPIVASGKNAATLHYTANQAAVGEGNLLLLDVGARVSGYAADVTRVLAHGHVSAEQQALYDGLLAAQQAIVALIRPGLRFEDYHAETERILEHAFRRLKLQGEVYEVMPHAVSHGLGVDVHDSLGGFDSFMPGMVLTVEPGIYLPKKSLGLRIEDDILVTADGQRNLSAGISYALSVY